MRSERLTKQIIKRLKNIYESLGYETVDDTRDRVHGTLSKIKYSEIFREKTLIVDLRDGSWYVSPHRLQQLRYWYEYMVNIRDIKPTSEIYEKNPQTGENYIATENDFTIEEYLKNNDIRIEEFGKFYSPILEYGRHKTIFLNEIHNSMCYNGCMISEDDFLKLCDEFDFISRDKFKLWGFVIEE